LKIKEWNCNEEDEKYHSKPIHCVIKKKSLRSLAHCKKYFRPIERRNGNEVEDAKKDAIHYNIVSQVYKIAKSRKHNYRTIHEFKQRRKK